MSNFKDKLQVFFLGLLLGLLLGGGFFLFKLDQYVNELSIYKSFSHTHDPNTDLASEKEDKSKEKINSRYKPMTAAESNPQRSHQPDSSRALNGSGNIRNAKTDSLKTNDSLNQVSAGNEDIILRKDQLVQSRSLELINVSAVASNSVAAKDSLAAKMAGVRDDHANGGRQFCSVEIWTSPLNYKGYKMNRNKIMLYGLNDPESLKVFKLDDEIYLQNGSQLFHLENTNDFKPYEKVSSEAVLSKLK
jgi:hypothetical protein